MACIPQKGYGSRRKTKLAARLLTARKLHNNEAFVYYKYPQHADKARILLSRAQWAGDMKHWGGK